MDTKSFETVQFTVGRSDGCDFKIIHSSVSRIHLKVYYTDQEVLIEDLNSKLGTFVFYQDKFKKIKTAKIKRDTMIRIGDILEPFPVGDLIDKFEFQREKERNNIKNKIRAVGVRRCGECGSVISKDKIHCHVCGAILEECA